MTSPTIPVLTETPEALAFTYTNWRGETAVRRIDPTTVKFCFDGNEWHPDPTWLMTAIDLDKGEMRGFAWDRIVFAASPALASPVPSDGGVMGLEWRKGFCDAECTIEQANTVGGLLQVRQFRGVIWLDHVKDSSEEFETVEAAKAAAQADHERRIRSCLVPSGGMDQEAVAAPEWDLIHDLIQTAKGYEGERGGPITDHLDAAENWLDKAEASYVAERAAHEETKRERDVVDAALSSELAAHAKTRQQLIEAREIARAGFHEKHAILFNRAEAAEARSALLEEPVETAGKALDDAARDAAMDAAYKFVFPKLSDMQQEKGAVGVWVDAYRTAWDAARRASLTQHKAPALPANDAEGGANG